MSSNPRAQKKRKTSNPDPENSDSDRSSTTGGVSLKAQQPKNQKRIPEAPPADDESDDDDKYASAESDSGADDEEDSGAESDDSISSLLAAQSEATLSKKRKRHDPDVFATSMSKILSSHLTTGARKDPVLVRAKQMGAGLEEAKLEAKARRIQKEERRKEKEKGRVRELIPKDDDAAAARALAKERLLKGVARSGVARLYNAIRAAQVKAEEATKTAKKEGMVGIKNREEKVTEMSKQGFLDLIQSTAKPKQAV
ncbi:Rrp15p-domain-containing protein [Ascodesmis nigricans]|uniref:Rrp15p-domain-containing protein n=1 Tax=Ascodesmis nigricans TaxID=341454 RepID=A0A4S2MX04_9PEZI|nr:Rrp15p-domain-containing protein [Ascodesmis nigricans]